MTTAKEFNTRLEAALSIILARYQALLPPLVVDSIIHWLMTREDVWTTARGEARDTLSEAYMSVRRSGLIPEIVKDVVTTSWVLNMGYDDDYIQQKLRDLEVFFGENPTT